MRQTPSSHTPPSTHLRFRSRLGAALSLLLIVTLVAACSGGPEPSSTTETTTPEPTETTETGENGLGVGPPPTQPGPGVETPDEPDNSRARTITVYVDGWSQLVAGSREISIQGVDKDAKTVRSSGTLTPVRSDELAELDDEKLRILVGRLIDTGRGYTCDAGVCSQEDGDTLNAVDLLTNPATIPGFGDAYSAWGLETALWKAELLVGKDSETVIVELGGVQSGFFETGHGYIEVDDELLLGVGLGTIFKLAPAWIDEPLPYSLAYPQVGIGEETGFLEGADLAIADAAGEGLGASGVFTYTLASSELTFLTSPTTGCGGWVTCVPGKADVEVISREREELGQFCMADQGEAVPVAISLMDETRRVTFDKPSHQLGAWNGTAASELPRGDDDNLWGTPPLVEGEQTFRVVTVHVWDGAMGGRLIGTAGYLAQDGFDSMEREIGMEDLLGSAYTPCS